LLGSISKVDSQNRFDFGSIGKPQEFEAGRSIIDICDSELPDIVGVGELTQLPDGKSPISQ